MTTIGSAICPPCRKASGGETPRARRRLREQSAPGSHNDKQWNARIEFQNSLCFWCFKLLRNSENIFTGTKEHLIPLSRGGNDYIENIVAACWPCNREKGTKTATEYVAYLGTRGVKISEVCTLTAFTKGAFSSTQTRFSAMPLEVREAMFTVGHSKTMAEPNYEARRKLLNQQVLEVSRLRAESAGQLTLPIFGDGTERLPVIAEAAALITSRGLHVADQPRRA